jgi:hypothetical protein
MLSLKVVSKRHGERDRYILLGGQRTTIAAMAPGESEAILKLNLIPGRGQ